MAFLLQWGTASLSIDSRSPLGDIVNRLHREQVSSQILVHLIAESGAMMSIGVGGESSILHYVSPGGWPAFTAMGAEPSAKGVLVFTVGDEETELPACFGMPIEKAKAGFLAFFEGLEMNEAFDWRED